MMRTITVEYFAILREQRGLSRESLATAAATPAALYDSLRSEHGFTLPGERVRAAVNGEFVDPQTGLNDGDEVVYIPPVAGG